jgi:hypothetical protein
MTAVAWIFSGANLVEDMYHGELKSGQKRSNFILALCAELGPDHTEPVVPFPGWKAF